MAGRSTPWSQQLRQNIPAILAVAQQQAAAKGIERRVATPL
jgi:hypothetical protein